jgi:hypothetical protein
MERRALIAAMFLTSFGLLLYELLLTRLFAVVLFADFAHLALALAMLGIAVGALAQHLWPSLVPDRGIAARLGWIALGQAAATIAAVAAAIRFPIVEAWETPPLTYQDRSHIANDLLDPVWFAALLPVLALPCAFAGLAFAGAFSRRKEHISALYGADLVGAGVAAIAFLPLLDILSGPDTAFVPILALAACALVLFSVEGSAGRVVAAGTGLAALVALGASLRNDLLVIRQSAGYAEDQLVYVRWTSLTRLAIERGKRGDYMLLDNASASEIFQTEARRAEVALEANRSLVYRLHDPPQRVAILAASAGPEVAVAQSLGYADIDAVDIAGEIFDIVAERYPTVSINPYLVGNTRRVKADGRSAILQARQPYDIIQMVHANLWSSAGLIANAWSPALLETEDAFVDYLRHLAPDGTLSFGRGAQTDGIFRSVVAALWVFGAEKPWQHVAWVGGRSTVLLVKPRPWTDDERARLAVAMEGCPGARLELDPTGEKPTKAFREKVGPAMTDDHPYDDTPERVWNSLWNSVEKQPLAALYRSILVQLAFVLAAGAVFIGGPLVWRGRSELAGTRNVATILAYVCCLGYGYLALETVAIHGLVLYVGHPTYAITVVVMAMLLGSGAGSAWSERLPARRLRTVLAAVLAIGAIGALFPAVLYRVGLQWSLPVRCAVTFAAMLPLAFPMGMAFPLGVRSLPDPARAVVPWAWALNGWMSVLASVGTVLLARLEGYSWAYLAALAAYALAWWLAPRLSRAAG